MKKIIFLFFIVFSFQNGFAQVEHVNQLYSNGKPKEVGTYVDGKKNGEYITYYENGNVRSYANYIFGKRQGIQKDYFSNGQLQHELECVNDVCHGISKTYYKDGKLQASSRNKNGVKDGKLVAYNKDGVLTVKEEWDNGKLVGESVYYYDSGQIRNRVVLDKKGNVKTTESYYENGKKNFFSDVDKNGNGMNYSIYPNDTIMARNYVKNHKVYKEESFSEQGKRKKITEYNDDRTYKNVKSFDENGELNREAIYQSSSEQTMIEYKGDIIEHTKTKNGYRDGDFESFYLNGTLAEKGTYFKSEKIGKWKSYYEDGAIKFIGNYVKTSDRGNFKDSIHTYYFNSGQIEKIENYYIAKINRSSNRPDDFYERTYKTGQWKTFYENGKLSQIANYNEDKLHGEFIEYFNDETNSVKYKCTYRNGLKIGLEQEYHENGKLYKSKEKDSNGYQIGKDIVYFENGIVKELTEYFDSQKQGKHLQNYENGKPKVEGRYNSGQEIGTWNYYYNNGKLFKSIRFDEGVKEKTFFYNDGVKFANILYDYDEDSANETFTFYNKLGATISFQELFNKECDNCKIIEFNVTINTEEDDIYFVNLSAMDEVQKRSISSNFTFNSVNHK
jgi:antitoxin component YwqK of YwqJK toxin-antitoxin module